MNASIYDMEVLEKKKEKPKPKDTNVLPDKLPLSILTDVGFEVRINKMVEWTPR